MSMLPTGLRITTALLAPGGWSVYVTRPKRKGTWVFVPDEMAAVHLGIVCKACGEDDDITIATDHNLYYCMTCDNAWAIDPTRPMTTPGGTR